MAVSYSHKFGQIIGDLLETAIEPHLQHFADKNKLYLDKKGNRQCRSGKKLTWIDGKNNKHDLDFVLEKNGSDSKIGSPVAFIEIAWRRYTKHSRNKAQEIQGAVLPLAEKYKHFSPFKGVVLAGEFTQGALIQLESLGFSVLYFPYNTVVEAFAAYSIDAHFDENTTEEEFKRKINNWESSKHKEKIPRKLLELNAKEHKEFFESLSKNVTRHVESVAVFTLHGLQENCNSILEAIKFLETYKEETREFPFAKYEVIIKYNTIDKIDAIFENKQDAIKFLKTYR